MVARPKTLPFETIADLVEQLGGIEPKRIRANPPPGTATEKDVLSIHDHEGRLYELINGVLVEKATGHQESRLAFWIGHLIQNFLDTNHLGEVAGAARVERHRRTGSA